MLKITMVILCTSLLLGCSEKENSCKGSNTKELQLQPVQSSIKISKYKITDTSIYGNGNTILNYKISSLDSLLDIIIFINDHKEFDAAQLNIERITELQKGEVESAVESKNILLTEKYKQIADVKVGYLKYLVEQKNNKFYAGRIYYYKDKKLVTIWIFEKYESEAQKNTSEIDCILESLTLH